MATVPEDAADALEINSPQSMPKKRRVKIASDDDAGDNAAAVRNDNDDLNSGSVCWGRFVEAVGALAGVSTTAAFIPQVYEIYVTSDTSGLSLPMYIIFVSGVLMWILYGVCKRAGSLVVANIVTFVLAGFILFSIVRDTIYPHPNNDEQRSFSREEDAPELLAAASAAAPTVAEPRRLSLVQRIFSPSVTTTKMASSSSSPLARSIIVIVAALAAAVAIGVAIVVIVRRIERCCCCCRRLLNDGDDKVLLHVDSTSVRDRCEEGGEREGAPVTVVLHVDGIMAPSAVSPTYGAEAQAGGVGRK